METLHYSIDIAAPAEVVWNTMLGEATYREWTGAFHAGSYFAGGWNTGDVIRFLGPNDDGPGEGGMLGHIVENRPHEFVSIEYDGFVNNGVDDTSSDFARLVTGTHENYTFTESNGVTTVAVDLDSVDEFREMFDESWPTALAKLKELAERA